MSQDSLRTAVLSKSSKSIAKKCQSVLTLSTVHTIYSSPFPLR